jgi:hypothetical protein
MGEAADDILCGMVCQCCGEWMDDILDGGDAPGYPRTCAGCGGSDQRTPSPQEVSDAQTPNGGWTRETLAGWDVPWPPPKGWRRLLELRWHWQRQQRP